MYTQMHTNMCAGVFACKLWTSKVTTSSLVGYMMLMGHKNGKRLGVHHPKMVFE